MLRKECKGKGLAAESLSEQGYITAMKNLTYNTLPQTTLSSTSPAYYLAPWPPRSCQVAIGGFASCWLLMCSLELKNCSLNQLTCAPLGSGQAQ